LWSPTIGDPDSCWSDLTSVKEVNLDSTRVIPGGKEDSRSTVQDMIGGNGFSFGLKLESASYRFLRSWDLRLIHIARNRSRIHFWCMTDVLATEYIREGDAWPSNHSNVGIQGNKWHRLLHRRSCIYVTACHEYSIISLAIICEKRSKRTSETRLANFICELLR
jgi:hypothetical protein